MRKYGYGFGSNSFCNHIRSGVIQVGEYLAGAGAVDAARCLRKWHAGTYVPLSGAAYEAAAGWDGKIVPAPIEDFAGLPLARLEALALKIKDELDSPVLIACDGGHGRTGMVIAAVAVVCGWTQDPITWVRKRYCPLAVESVEQERVLSVLATKYKLLENK